LNFRPALDGQAAAAMHRSRSSRFSLKEKPMLKNLKNLIKDEEGATAVEYGLIVAAIAGLIIVVVFLLGNKVNNAFSNVAAHMP
jgi:pilus assembly protein Flp/PilA